MPRRSPSELIFLRADIRHFSLKKKKKTPKNKKTKQWYKGSSVPVSRWSGGVSPAQVSVPGLPQHLCGVGRKCISGPGTARAKEMAQG